MPLQDMIKDVIISSGILIAAMASCTYVIAVFLTLMEQLDNEEK